MLEHPVSDWLTPAFRPAIFLKTPTKHAAEPRDHPCRPQAPQRVGVLGLGLGLGLGSGWACADVQDGKMTAHPVLTPKMQKRGCLVKFGFQAHLRMGVVFNVTSVIK